MTDIVLDRRAGAPDAEAPPPFRTRADSPKSLRTRARILDAAMRLFAEAGYAGATNARIAEAADLTRGAMLYHFPSREDLVEAAVAHIQHQRTELFNQVAHEKPADADAADYAIDSYWALLHTPPFRAFAELEAAAKSDAWLAQAIRPAQETFDRAQLGHDAEHLVQAGGGSRLQASRDLARFLLEGLSRAVLADDGDGRTARLLEVVKRATHTLNRKGPPQDLWPEG